MNFCCSNNDCGLRFEKPAIMMIEHPTIMNGIIKEYSCPRCGCEELVEARNWDERRIIGERNKKDWSNF